MLAWKASISLWVNSPLLPSSLQARQMARI